MVNTAWGPEVYRDFMVAAFDAGRITTEQLDRIVMQLHERGHPCTRESLLQHAQRMVSADNAARAASNASSSGGVNHNTPSSSEPNVRPDSHPTTGQLRPAPSPHLATRRRRAVRRNGSKLAQPLDRSDEDGEYLPPKEKKQRTKK
ncbi:hypothetical protein F4781DRAFT_442032 [Annulohypoxylon bovei var. microspora]|nr:hypothetical protein F4781DRAFT_442032 [Annulohypoxylon bovei var. microspora]